MPRPITPIPSSDDSDDDIVLLDIAPPHLRRRTNINNPIEVSSDSEEEPDPSSQASTDVELIPDIEVPVVAGPSRAGGGGVGGGNGGVMNRGRPIKRARADFDFERDRDGDSDLEDLPPTPVRRKHSGPSKTPALPLPTPPPQPAMEEELDPQLTPSQVTPTYLLPMLLDILPDLDRVYALSALSTELAKGSADRAVGIVLEAVLEFPGGYPKEKGKGKAEGGGGGEDGEEGDYGCKTFRKGMRVGDIYYGRSMNALDEHFPKIPLPHIRQTFFANNNLYFPAYISLVAQSTKSPLPYVELKASRQKSKGKTRFIPPAHVGMPSSSQSSNDEYGFGDVVDDGGDGEFEKERAFLEDYLSREESKKDEETAKKLATEESLANGGGLECGCCFGESVWEDMFQCSEGHLFCRECCVMYVETKLGEQIVITPCMDTSSCPAPFPERELLRLLPPKSIDLYHRLQQSDSLEKAEIDGLESCPNCPFAVVIEDPGEKLFRCLREGCGVVSCRKCRRPEHLPKSCEEMDTDRKLDKRHAVEEAMSEALVRKCPNSACGKPFVKESGCNKITCHKCNTISCYLCRKTITNGYDHFDREGHVPGGERTGKCSLFEANEMDQENNRIIAARDEARRKVEAEAEAEGVELSETDLQVDHPTGARAPVPGQAARNLVPDIMHHHARAALAAIPMHRGERRRVQYEWPQPPPLPPIPPAPIEYVYPQYRPPALARHHLHRPHDRDGFGVGPPAYALALPPPPPLVRGHVDEAAIRARMEMAQRRVEQHRNDLMVARGRGR